MPDFEALIRHQQLEKPQSPKRLKVVDSPELEKENNEQSITKETHLLGTFFISFIGSLIGTLTILFLYINDYLPMDLIKLK